MKKNLVVFSLILSIQLAYSSDPQYIVSDIKEVTVFLRGAQISREAPVILQKGSATLVFHELPVNIDPQSIQARGEGNYTILSILHQTNYLAGQRKTAQVKQLQDSLKIYEWQLDWVNKMQAVMKSEEDMLNANREIGSSEKGIVLAELKQAADFFRTRLTEIKKEEQKLSREGTHIQERIEKIRNQLNLLSEGLNQPTSEVLVNVSCNENSTGKIYLTYTVFDAGWVPVYDLRAKDIESPVKMTYNARVFQNTGENWEKVDIKLSTANPQQRGEKPNLLPWYIDFEQPIMPIMQYNMARPSVARKEAMADVPVEELSEGQDALTTASFTEVEENQTNLEFHIKIPYDIPSDNKQYTINIQDYSLPAVYEYYCAPKIDREAFLVARITGWENLNLLSGEINLFFEGTYVGKSHLNIRHTRDTLDLSLGRDKSILVTRVKMKDFTEEKTIGANKRETRAWEITLRNTKKDVVALRLEDQIPISMNKDIEVEALDYSGGNYNKETGLITWKQQLEPSAEKKLRISFAVKYPKDQQIYID